MTTEELIRALVMDARDGRRRNPRPSGQVQGEHPVQRPVTFGLDGCEQKSALPSRRVFRERPKKERIRR